MLEYHNKNNIFWFDVSVEDFVLVHAFYSLKEVLGNKGSGLLRKIFVLGDNIVELAVRAEFEKSVEVSLIMEKTVNINDVGMIQEGLDLQLSNELLEDIILNYFFLLQHFHCHYEASMHLHHQINFPEFPFP